MISSPMPAATMTPVGADSSVGDAATFGIWQVRLPGGHVGSSITRLNTLRVAESTDRLPSRAWARTTMAFAPSSMEMTAEVAEHAIDCV
ncbi:hypothetical protein ACFQV2_09065 [Actinokineospora soli]|uniref:Uncharacterized protein n=1 Tax=Actinokineospora soli TaxID=1048753 RepID=A0ABW2TLJ4_9PSEU